MIQSLLKETFLSGASVELLVGKATGVFVGFQVVPQGSLLVMGEGDQGHLKTELSPDGKSI